MATSEPSQGDFDYVSRLNFVGLYQSIPARVFGSEICERECLKARRNRPETRSAKLFVIAFLRRGQALIDGASRTVEREGRWNCVGSAPRAVEAEAGIAAARGDVLPRLARLLADRDVGSALRNRSIPRTGDGLPVGEAPRQRPVAQRGGSAILDGDSRPKAALPLAGDRVVHLASRRAASRGTDRERNRGACRCAPRGSGDGDGVRAGSGRAAGRQRERAGGG